MILEALAFLLVFLYVSWMVYGVYQLLQLPPDDEVWDMMAETSTSEDWDRYP